MINAEKVKGRDGQVWIKVWFKYNKEVTSEVSKIKGALYSSQNNCWAIPSSSLPEFEEKIGDFLIVWHGVQQKNNGGIDEKDIPDQPMVPGYSVTYDAVGNITDHTGFKTRPWGEFQVKGFNMMVHRDFLILADDAGLGKSWQVGTAMEAKKKLGQVKHGIIVAKASLLYNWRDEIQMHTNEKAVVVAGTIKERMKEYDRLKWTDDWTFIIVSYETFRVDLPVLQLVDDHRPLDFCVIDEAHKIKNPQSKIGNMIHYLPYKCKYVLTATPLINNPLEAFNYLKFGRKLDMNWFEFENYHAVKGGYGNKDVLHYKNMRELKGLIQVNMLRRRKFDKLKELPEVTFKTIPLQMTKEQNKLYNAVKKEILEDLKDTSLEKVPSSLAKLMRLQQITNSTELIGAEPSKNSSVKLNALDDLLEQLTDSGEKVIVFSRFRTMVELIQKRYESLNPAVIHGDVDANGKPLKSAERLLRKQYGDDQWYTFSKEQRAELLDDTMTSERQKEVYKFQNDESCKLFIGCTPACREGLTLTKATHVIFIDCEWSPAYVEQAYSRAHRIGQRQAVTVYYLVCEETIDEFVQETLKRKESMAQAMIDDGIDSVGHARAKEVIASMLGIDLKYGKVS